MTIGLRTLVLTNSYMPISIFPLHTIPVEDAVTRVVNGTCHVVFEYNRKILTQKTFMNWPSVIARKESMDFDDRVKLNEESLYYRDHGKCAYCEKSIKLGELTCDHVIPESKGGKFSWDNIISACGPCNTAKADHMPTGKWRPKWMPFKPTYYQLLSQRRKFPIVIDDECWMNFLGKWDSDVIVRG